MPGLVRNRAASEGRASLPCLCQPPSRSSSRSIKSLSESRQPLSSLSFDHHERSRLLSHWCAFFLLSYPHPTYYPAMRLTPSSSLFLATLALSSSSSSLAAPTDNDVNGLSTSSDVHSSSRRDSVGINVRVDGVNVDPRMSLSTPPWRIMLITAHLPRGGPGFSISVGS